MWGHCWENNSTRQGTRGGIWQVTRKTEHAEKLKWFEQRADMPDYVIRKTEHGERLKPPHRHGSIFQIWGEKNFGDFSNDTDDTTEDILSLRTG